jgi:hypothetical protein
MVEAEESPLEANMVTLYKSSLAKNSQNGKSLTHKGHGYGCHEDYS